MKTISSRFLRAAISLVLVVMLLFSSTISGLAAVVDNADTSANVDLADTSYYFQNFYFIFDDTNTGWGGSYKLQLLYGHGTYSSTANLTKIANTNLYACSIGSKWDNATEFCVIGNTSNWGSEGSSPSNRRGYATKRTNVIKMSGNYEGFFYGHGASSSNNCTLTCTYSSSGYSYYNSTQSATIQSTNDNSTYTTNSNAGSVAYSTYRLNGNSSSTSSTGTNSATAAKTASVSMTATAKSGYQFAGWATSSSGAITSTNNPLTYTCKGATTYYARFKKLHTVTYNVDGVTTTEKVAAGDSPANIPTLTDKTGYTCIGWDNNPNGAVITADTTYTATYTANTYNVILNTQGGTIDDGNVTSYTYGTTTTLPTADQMSYAGFEFAGWFENAAGTGSQILEISATETGDKTYYAKWVKNEVYYDLSTSAQYSTNGTNYTVGSTGGTATPVTTNVLAGSDVEINATPASGYEFVGWYLNGSLVSEDTTYTVRVNETATYVAKFVKVYTITVTSEDGITAEASATQVRAGAQVTLTASDLQSGYRFEGWDINSSVNKNMVVTLTVTSNINATATTVEVYDATYEIYCNGVSKNYAGKVTVTPAQAAVGETVTYFVEADDYDKDFYGLYANTSFDDTPDYTPVSSGNDEYTYELKMVEGGISVYALFYDVYTGFRYDPVENSYSRTLTNYNVDGAVIRINDGEGESRGVAVGTTDGVTIAYANDAYTIDINEIDYDPTQPIELTLELNAEGDYVLNATAVAKERFQVSYAQGTNGSNAGDYAVGAPVTLTIAVDSTHFLKGVTFKNDEGFVIPTEEDNDLSINTSNATVTFTMPEGNVEVSAVYGDKRYVRFEDETGLAITYYPTPNGYVPTTEVRVTVAPSSDAYVVNNNFTVTPADTSINLDYEVVYNDEDDTYTITIASMPDCDVNVTTDVDASFLMDYQIKTVRYNSSSTSVSGTVEMTANGEVINNTVYNPKGTEVTYTATANPNYTFIGFFSDTDCKKLLTTETTYTVVPTDHTTVYALFARDQYIIGQKVTGGWTIYGDTVNYDKMTYDYKEKAYTYQAITDDLSSSTTFKITYNPTAESSNDWDGWNYYVYKKDTLLNYDNTLCRGVTIQQDNNANMEVSKVTGSAYTAPLTIYFKPNGTKFDVYAKASYKGAKVYLSSGRLDLWGDISAVSEFIDPKNVNMTVTGPTNITRTADNVTTTVEKYYVGTMNDAQSFTIQTNLSGDNAKDYYVESYIVYYIDSKTYDVIPRDEIANMGVNRYSASVMCHGDCYIVPILYHTDEYISTNNIDTYTVYFDATSADMDYWGPFVACYPYGESKTDGGDTLYELNGSWPGQLMIPNDDGTSYSIRLELDPSVNFQGVVFNNYLQNSVPVSQSSHFGLGTENCQTYDYKESVYLYNAGYAAITYVMKTSEDGYHGQYIDAENKTAGLQNEWTVTTNNIADLVEDGELIFEPLVNRNGTALMDLAGNDIGSNFNATPDYYIVSAGDILVEAGDAIDPEYAGKWSVAWFIYNANSGERILSVLSGTMYNGIDGPNGSVLKQEMLKKGYEIDGKVVNISYELNNACADDNYYPVGTTKKEHWSDNDRFDGQWYGNKADDKMNTQIYVGLFNDETGVYDIDADNKAEYGEAYINKEFQSYDVSYAAGIVNLSATPLVGNDGKYYRYDGMYILDDGEYKKIAESYNYSPTVTNDTIYYALFSQISDNELLITHQPYANFEEVEILSHNGIATMNVSIYAYDKETGTRGDLLASGDDSIFLSQATTDITNGNSYLVEIETTPLNQGRFYAWYTDSTKVDGTPTYEEIMTLKDEVNKQTKVTNSFVYTASERSQRVINIYSDVTRVTNKAMLIYRYLNRFGEWRTYTIPEIELTDNECLGYEGNNFEPYVPTYRTAYIMSKEGEPDETVYGEGDYETFTELGYKLTSSTNKIQFYAPSAKVTQAFDEEIEWVVTDVQLTYQKSLITLEATQNDPVYTVNYIIDGETDKVSGVYNTLIEDVVAPETNSAGDEFSYWIDTKTQEILSYSRFYNYRIVEDKTIMAMYGITVGEDEWTASINSVTYTREYQDTSDYVYTDFLIDFTNTNVTAPELDEIKYSEGIKYGLIMVREANVSYDPTKTTDEQAYPDSETIIEGVKTTALAGSNQTINAGGSKYAAHCYDLTSYDTTNFNRMDYYIKYNNSVEKYRNYLWTCYAYIIEDGEVKLSEPVNVSIYECATAAVK